MDVQMPVMDGMQATLIIRKEIDKEIPILALTSHVLKDKIAQLMAAGMNDLIYKPYDEVKLVAIISKWVTKSTVGKPKKGEAAVMNEPEEIKTAITSYPLNDNLYDLTQLKNMGRNDPAFISKMVLLFINEASNGLQKIIDASEHGDVDTIAYFAHRMKPSIFNMGINSIRTEILAIEAIKVKSMNNSELIDNIKKVKTVITEVITRLKAEYQL